MIRAAYAVESSVSSTTSPAAVASSAQSGPQTGHGGILVRARDREVLEQVVGDLGRDLGVSGLPELHRRGLELGAERLGDRRVEHRTEGRQHRPDAAHRHPEVVHTRRSCPREQAVSASRRASRWSARR